VTIELSGPTQIAADRAQLRRALINLVRNALAAAGTGPRAQVVLAARRHADRVRIEVRDSGAGVPAPLREKIFEPFFTTREKGTGLGLAFVREIVRDHGGDITVDQAPEGGARFTFDVPAA
jgi:signal transduction histidine kinase